MIYSSVRSMEKITNHYDSKEYMKMSMLKQEETFREQVNELHRLYKVQRILMRDVVKNKRCNDPHYEIISSNHQNQQPQTRKLCLDLERAVRQESDELTHDLELTLGSRSYNNLRKINLKAAVQSDYSGPSISSSSTSSRDQESSSSKQKLWDLDLPLQKQQDRSSLNHNNNNNNHSPPWLFKAALSLNMT